MRKLSLTILMLILMLGCNQAADVVVEVAASGGDFTTITAAVAAWDAQTDANDTYIVRLTDAAHTENVDINIAGSDIDSLVIDGNTDIFGDRPIITGGIFHRTNDLSVLIRRLIIEGGTDNIAGSVHYGVYGNAGVATELLTVERVTVRNFNVNDSGTENVEGISWGSMGGNASNCQVYNLIQAQTGGGNRHLAAFHMGGATVKIYNCTADSIVNNTGAGRARAYYMTNSANYTLKNCAASGVYHNDTGVAREYHVTSATPLMDWNNCSYEVTAPTMVGLVQIDPDVDYVDVSTFDYTLAASSGLLDAGVDVGTIFNSNLSLNNRDRDAESDTWDIGALEFFEAGAATATNPGYTRYNLSSGYSTY